MKKKQTGITLIALVITIIILMLLTGLIMRAFESGGLVSNTGEVVDQKQIANKKSEIEESIARRVIQTSRGLGIEDIFEQLEKDGIIEEGNSNIENGRIKIEPEGYVYEIVKKANGDWKVTYIGKGDIGQEEITIEISKNTIGLTEKVVLTVVAKAESGIKSYLTPTGNEKTYEEGITEVTEIYEVTENGTYTFTVTNNNGVTKSESVIVDNLGNEIKISANPTKQTKENVVVTIEWPSVGNKGIQEIKIGDKGWEVKTGETTQVTVTENNVTVKAKVSNTFNEVYSASLTIDNIDKLAPNQFTPTATATTTTITVIGETTDQVDETKKNICSGIAIYYFSKDNGETWQSNSDNPLTTSYTYSGLTQETTYNIKMKAVDKAGNETTTEEKVQVTTDAPRVIETPTLSVSPDPKDGYVTECIVTATWPGDTTGLTKRIKANGSDTWSEYIGPVTVTENCTVKAQLIDLTTGEGGGVATLTITNIDKNPPIVTAKVESLTIKQGDTHNLETYFTIEQNGEAPITETICINTSDNNKEITNTNTLTEGTHVIKCIVTKENGLSGNDVITIVVEKSILTDGSWNEKANVNSPYLMDGMTAVYWSTDGGTTASTTEEGATPIYSKIGGISTGANNPAFNWENWYNYVSGDNATDTKTSRWANAVTDDGSYWVWIPRYKYLISDQPTSASTTSSGKVTIKFIPTSDRKGATGYSTAANSDGEILTTDSEGYIIHPAFEDGSSNGKNNGYANGEWNYELPGFWMAKYEMSMEDGNGNHVETDSADVGNVKISDSVQMVSKPNVSSWRYIQIGQAYQNGLLYDESKNSHMVKNSEWGAVAYLTQSQYGRNRNEITVNNSQTYITGNAGNSPTDNINTGGITNAYNTTAGMLASTTGNIYGIYDMSGGAGEFVSAWDTLSTDYNVTSRGKAVDGTEYFTIGGVSDHTKTAYSNGTSECQGENAIALCKIGDGIKETCFGLTQSWRNRMELLVYGLVLYYVQLLPIHDSWRRKTGDLWLTWTRCIC